MLRGLYTSASSMLKSQKRMDIVSNNLSNSATTGYKKDIAVSQSFPELLTKNMGDVKSRGSSGNIGKMSLGTDVVKIHTDFSQGVLVRTDISTDITIKDSPKAFFAVDASSGEDIEEEMYTRDGSWTIDDRGYLVTRQGYRVLGEYGHIYMGSQNFDVQEDGSLFIDNEFIDRLKIVEFPDTSAFEKRGNNILKAPEDALERNFSGKVAQGFIENSNTNSIEEMVEMITIMRSYEANQKVIKAYDDTLDKVINEVGRT